MQPLADPDLATILPDALATETLALQNAEAWRVMGVRLATAGIRRMSEVRDKAWAIRRELLRRAST